MERASTAYSHFAVNFFQRIRKHTMTARCGWVNLSEPLYIAYHDEEWGLPVQTDC
jgi:hypothetical protein